MSNKTVKDYYKILNLGDEATEAEIQARWIELMNRYQPDLAKDKEAGEKMEEISEAYEVLKNNSARSEYDRYRTLNKTSYREALELEEGRRHIHKTKFFAGILLSLLVIVLLMMGLFHLARSPKSGFVYQEDKLSEKKPSSQISSAEKIPKIYINDEVSKEVKKEVMPQVNKELVSLTPQRSSPGADRESKEKGEPAQGVPPISEMLVKKERSDDLMREAPKEIQKKVQNVNPGEVAGINLAIKSKDSTPALLATEEEVKQFFFDYINRYKSKDIAGFISFFSSKAIHNQKDGLEGVRIIYTKFFNQSQELQYRLEDMKIMIYENGVDVKARFRVDQKLKKEGEQKIWKGNIHWVLIKEEGSLKISSLDYQNDKVP